MIYTLSTGDKVHKYDKSIVIQFEDDRKVLSTSPINGGYREDIKTIFNRDENPGAGIACKLKAPTYSEHMYLIAEQLGLKPEETVGISTAASMENLSIKSESFDEVIVTAIVTGGVEVNGGRVGDPASYYEKNCKVEMIKHGTINIILVIDGNLPPETMTRALVTCTEAKTAALQELMAGSNYSRGIATGSGTDGTIIVCNSKSKIKLTNAGKHSKLGELIGVAVKRAVKEALFLQTGLSPQSQHSMLKRVKRFGIDENKIWNKYEEIYCEYLSEENKEQLAKPEFIHNLHMIDRREGLVTLTSLYAHIIDQLDWGLLSPSEVVSEANEILSRILEKFSMENSLIKIFELDYSQDKSVEEVAKMIIDRFILIMAQISGGIKDV